MFYNKEIFHRCFRFSGRYWYKNIRCIPLYFKEMYYLVKNGYDEFATWDTYSWFIQNMKHLVQFGIVDLQIYDDVYINLLAPKETRLIDGVPIEQVEFPTRYEKPPKQGTLSRVTNDDSLQECIAVDIKNPQEIKNAYDKGLLVEKGKLILADVDVEGTSKRSRLVLKFWNVPQCIASLSVNANRLYFTYEEAQKDVDEYNKEVKRLNELTNEEWSIENIDKTLMRFKLAYQIPEDDILKYRAILLAKKNIEDIEVRTYFGGLQWRYWKTKNWLYVDIDDYNSL